MCYVIFHIYIYKTLLYAFVFQLLLSVKMIWTASVYYLRAKCQPLSALKKAPSCIPNTVTNTTNALMLDNTLACVSVLILTWCLIQTSVIVLKSGTLIFKISMFQTVVVSGMANIHTSFFLNTTLRFLLILLWIIIDLNLTMIHWEKTSMKLFWWMTSFPWWLFFWCYMLCLLVLWGYFCTFIKQMTTCDVYIVFYIVNFITYTNWYEFTLSLLLKLWQVISSMITKTLQTLI